MADILASPARPLPTRMANQAKPMRALGGFVDSDDEDEDSTGSANKIHDDVDDVDMDDDMLQAQLHEMEAEAARPTPAEEPEQTEDERYDLLFSAGTQSVDLADSTDSTDSTDTRDTRDTRDAPAKRTIVVQTCGGRAVPVQQRATRYGCVAPVAYKDMVAQRSRTREGRAQRSFFGVAIHALMDSAQAEIAAAKTQSTEAEAARSAAAATARADAVAAATAHVLAEVGAEGIPAADKVQSRSDPVSGPKQTKTTKKAKKTRTLLWTEKYRAKTFMDLVGDDLTNRVLMKWLKRWDPVVFPGTRPPKAKTAPPAAETDEKPHRTILILAGPPGLGKTTLAHVCARQAGYDVLEINASDDRSRDVVDGRIRTSLGTESVTMGVATKTSRGRQGRQGRPVCVVVDEVDGVVGGGAGGEGGFVKALIDLVHTDQRNAGVEATTTTTTTKPGRKKRRGDDFRQMRPLILICNDVYHASLRPLRLSGLAEIVHVGRPSVDAVVARLASIFEKEGISCERDAARKVCEAAWGVATGGPAKRGTESGAEGDLRGVMVVGEWVARRLRAGGASRLTRAWVETHILPDLTFGGGTTGGAGSGLGARGLGRGGVREIVARCFQEGAGFPRAVLSGSGLVLASSVDHKSGPRRQMGFAEHQRTAALARLREMVDTSGDVERVVTDLFSEYPRREFTDDAFLSKPEAAYEWLHFYDACARRVFASQEWELAAYTSQPVLAWHLLFASPKRHEPEDDPAGPAGPGSAFSGARADFLAREAEKVHRAALQALQARLPATLLRAFRNTADVAAELLPYAVRLVSPDVKPVLVHQSAAASDKARYPMAVASVRRESEKALVRRAADVLAALGLRLQRGILEGSDSVPGARPQWVYRLDPDLDLLATFETAGGLVLAGQAAPARYAVRQVLDQALRQALASRDNAARHARFAAGSALGAAFAPPPAAADDDASKKRKAVDEVAVKRDFFGRVVAEVVVPASGTLGSDGLPRRDKPQHAKDELPEHPTVWVTFHEGLNNAVRKPISVDEFLRGL